MIDIGPGTSYFDLEFQGRSRVIACGVLTSSAGVALVDPGPASTLPTLYRELSNAGIAGRDLSALVLTHIHLDHAGAAGTLVREHPGLRVFVHEAGAPHLADPSRLLASATRLYGDSMDRLWGEVAPVPRDAIDVLCGGERIDAGGRRLDVLYTPGHASHHLSYFDGGMGLAFVGDTAGICIAPHDVVLPPTPPPDIDLEAWRESVDAIERWGARSFLLTHFGTASHPDLLLDRTRESLDLVRQLSSTSLGLDGSDADREAWYVTRLREELRRRLNDGEAMTYEVSGRFDLNWRGMARYWKKRGPVA